MIFSIQYLKYQYKGIRYLSYIDTISYNTLQYAISIQNDISGITKSDQDEGKNSQIIGLLQAF